MKKLSGRICQTLVFSIIVLIGLSSCKKTENPIKFPTGTFPDSTFILTDLNSSFDDYEMTNMELVIDDINTDVHQLRGNIMVIFSSNRANSGENYDLTQGILTFNWDQTIGDFELGTEIEPDAFLTSLIQSANTSGDDLAPYRRFSTVDGYEYLLLSSENLTGDLDFYYLKNLPFTGTSLPAVLGPTPVKLLNTSADDVYISFDTNMDSAYFSSNTEGNFEIYMKTRPAETDLTTWFNGTYASSLKVDSINSAFDDKCPIVYKKILVFASNRPGGIGGYDLYYSIFRNGKWNSPVNFGPDVNTAYDEYRPVLGSHAEFENNFIIYSSDRPGGKGLFDLYFNGVTIK